MRATARAESKFAARATATLINGTASAVYEAGGGSINAGRIVNEISPVSCWSARRNLAGLLWLHAARRDGKQQRRRIVPNVALSFVAIVIVVVPSPRRASIRNLLAAITRSGSSPTAIRRTKSQRVLFVDADRALAWTNGRGITREFGMSAKKVFDVSSFTVTILITTIKHFESDNYKKYLTSMARWQKRKRDDSLSNNCTRVYK